MDKARQKSDSIARRVSHGVGALYACGRHLGLAAIALLLGASTAHAAPNIVLAIIDNAVASEVDSMPRTSAYLRANGMEFSNAYVTNSLCGPSRSTILTGKYSHNTRVLSNDGSYDAFYGNGNEQNTMAVWLKARGYRTALVGKYINGYVNPKQVPRTHVPAGWDLWYGLSARERYYDYQLNENGVLVSYGASAPDYLTDRLSEKTTVAVNSLIGSGSPFFLYLSLLSPHEDSPTGTGLATPAPRHAALLAGRTAPRNPSFNEADVTDKPTWLRNQIAPLTPDAVARIDASYRSRALALQSADELIGKLIDQLRTAGVLDNTIIMLISDNAFFFGEHQKEKGNGPMYEVTNRIPLLIAGPGIVPASRSAKLVVNTDLFPTIAELAGVDVPTAVDGRSFASVAKSVRRGADTGRKSILRVRTNLGAGLRLPSYNYYESYRSDGLLQFRELYDLEVDPDETRNLFTELTADSAAKLRDALTRLKTCSGAGCRLLEDTIGDDLVKFVWAPAATPP